jgi:hypothetical protein
MKKVWFITLLLVFCWGCTGGEDKVKIPSDVVPPREMILLLVDFHLAEVSLQQLQNDGKNPAEYTALYYPHLLRKHNIDKEAFIRSLDFYSHHPRLLRQIYDEVISELSTLQSLHAIRMQP